MLVPRFSFQSPDVNFRKHKSYSEIIRMLELLSQFDIRGESATSKYTNIQIQKENTTNSIDKCCVYR